MSNGFAFGGGMGTGKTTAARYLVEEHGFVQLGFATPLYEVGDIHQRAHPTHWRYYLNEWAFQVLGRAGYDWRDRKKFVDAALAVFRTTQRTPNGGKNRTLLQLIGTEVGRDTVDPDLWTKLFEKSARERIAEGRRVVNDNLRFENELASAERVGLTTVFFEIPEHVQDERYYATYGVYRTAEQKTHASERELAAVKAGCDLTYVNEGTIQDLQRYMDYLVLNTTVEV